ncbi:MAG: EAL domain-containing protein [Thermochromatium sp.]
MTPDLDCAQALIDALIDAVWLVDARDLRLLTVNQAAEELLGQDRVSLIGRPVSELVCTPEDLFFWEDVAAGRKDILTSETLLRRGDGTLATVLRRVSWISGRDADGLYVVCFSDQTERRAAENELERLVAELRATLESSTDGILVMDFDGAIRNFNQRFAELWHLPDTLLTTRNDAGIYDWMRQEVLDPDGYTARLKAIAENPLLEASDLLTLRQGQVLERVTLPQYVRGHPIGRIYVFRDITQRLQDERQLRLAARVFESSLDAIFLADPEFRILAVNPASERLSGRASADLIGQRLDRLLSLDVGDRLDPEIQAALDRCGHWQGEREQPHADGSTLSCLVSLIRVSDGEGQTIHHIGFIKDLSELVAARRRIEQLAFTDTLTGLPNRIQLNERLRFSIQLAQREKTRFAVLFIDLDRFKHINDSLGHVFGDRVLIEVARRIQQCLRHVDTLARLGGDEFVLLLHQVEPFEAERVARRLLNAIDQPFELDGVKFSLSCSIGIALYPDDGETLDELIKNADSAMYYVKEHGRGDCCFYQRRMNIDLLERVRLDHAMREALQQGHFWLAYQPQVDLHSGLVVGAEALLRWRDPELGELSPGRFIPIAEETGFIVPLGTWVLRETIRQGALWQAQGLDLTLSVNVSAAQFQQANFIDLLAQYLDETDLLPGRLELELTESILIHNVEETLQRLEALEALGVRLAVDDFGTGYSSLAYLKRFPIHKLKIDQSFVRDIPHDESDTAIAKAVIGLASALNLRVIAEGVETEIQRQFLMEAGCHEFQGYLCAPALKPEAFLDRIRQIGLAPSPSPALVKKG